MAATSQYPINSALVRGDPVEIPVNLSVAGVPFDASPYSWRAQIRSGFDGTLITEFTCTVVTPSGGTTPSQILLTLTDDEARKLDNGMVFDLEQLDAPPPAGNTIKTWWIVTRLNVQPDVSYDAATILAKSRPTVERLR